MARRTAEGSWRPEEQAAPVDSSFRLDVNRWLARAYQLQGNLPGSESAYLTAIDLLEHDDAQQLNAWIAQEYDLDPNDYLSELHDELAVQLAAQERHEEAIEHARRAVDTNAKNLNAYHTLLASLQATGNTRQLAQWLHRARENDTLGLVDQWVEELGLEESGGVLPWMGAEPADLEFDGIELPGYSIDEDDS